jgi:hypothetical protein
VYTCLGVGIHMQPGIDVGEECLTAGVHMHSEIDVG